MSARWLAVLGLLAPQAAFAGWGAGVTAAFDYFPRYGEVEIAAPGGLGCFGAVGFHAASNGLRLGGEASFCRGRPGVSLSFGGAQLGFHRTVGPLWWSVHSGVGMGSTTDRSSYTGEYSALFGYLRPEVSVGFSWGVTAVEFGVHVLAPLNLVQWVGQGEPRGVVTPIPGAQVSLLFGSFRPRVRVAPVDEPTTTPDGWPLAIPGPSTPHDQSPPPGAQPPAANGDDLAIPAEEPPPREAPMDPGGEGSGQVPPPPP